MTNLNKKDKVYVEYVVVFHQNLFTTYFPFTIISFLEVGGVSFWCILSPFVVKRMERDDNCFFAVYPSDRPVVKETRSEIPLLHFMIWSYSNHL